VKAAIAPSPPLPILAGSWDAAPDRDAREPRTGFEANARFALALAARFAYMRVNDIS
jgi:hypothetical protein